MASVLYRSHLLQFPLLSYFCKHRSYYRPRRGQILIYNRYILSSVKKRFYPGIIKEFPPKLSQLFYESIHRKHSVVRMSEKLRMNYLKTVLQYNRTVFVIFLHTQILLQCYSNNLIWIHSLILSSLFQCLVQWIVFVGEIYVYTCWL